MSRWFPRKSTLKLCYVIMSKESRFWLHEKCWGAAEGRDMCDAMTFNSEKDAELALAKMDRAGTVYEIGLYNGKPVMLVDAYSYWLDANYTPKKS